MKPNALWLVICIQVLPPFLIVHFLYISFHNLQDLLLLFVVITLFNEHCICYTIMYFSLLSLLKQSFHLCLHYWSHISTAFSMMSFLLNCGCARNEVQSDGYIWFNFECTFIIVHNYCSLRRKIFKMGIMVDGQVHDISLNFNGKKYFKWKLIRPPLLSVQHSDGTAG